MRFLWELLWQLMPQLFESILDKAKSAVRSLVVQAALQLRPVIAMGLMAVLMAVLCGAGFILLHIALYLLLPWQPETKAWVLLGLGAFYLVVPAAIMAKAMSRRTWERLSHFEE